MKKGGGYIRRGLSSWLVSMLDRLVTTCILVS